MLCSGTVYRSLEWSRITRTTPGADKTPRRRGAASCFCEGLLCHVGAAAPQVVFAKACCVMCAHDTFSKMGKRRTFCVVCAHDTFSAKMWERYAPAPRHSKSRLLGQPDASRALMHLPQPSTLAGPRSTFCPVNVRKSSARWTISGHCPSRREAKPQGEWNSLGDASPLEMHQACSLIKFKEY